VVEAALRVKQVGYIPNRRILRHALTTVSSRDQLLRMRRHAKRDQIFPLSRSRCRMQTSPLQCRGLSHLSSRIPHGARPNEMKCERRTGKFEWQAESEIIVSCTRTRTFYKRECGFRSVLNICHITLPHVLQMKSFHLRKLPSPSCRVGVLYHGNVVNYITSAECCAWNFAEQNAWFENNFNLAFRYPHYTLFSVEVDRM